MALPVILSPVARFELLSRMSMNLPLSTPSSLAVPVLIVCSAYIFIPPSFLKNLLPGFFGTSILNRILYSPVNICWVAGAGYIE